jgi:hypothetical protein
VAAAAAAAVIFYLPTTQERIETWRTAGVTDLVKDYRYLKMRKQESRLTGGFPHRQFEGTKRGDPPSDDQEGPLRSSATRLQYEIPPDTTSVRKLRALAFAQHLDGKRDEAVATMNKAVHLAGEPDADLLSDLSAMYLERARFRGVESDYAAALKHAQDAWEMEKKP